MIESARVAARDGLPFECYWIRARGSSHPAPPHVQVIEVDHRFGDPGLRIAQYRALARLALTRPRIVLRYPIADPALLALTRRGTALITEHHSKEVDELQLDQPGRARLERWFGPPVLRRTHGIVAVTREILDYECARAGGERRGLVAPNAIDVDGDGPDWLATPWQRHTRLRLLFVASTVHPWHGLDLILDALAEVDRSRYELHVCGLAETRYEQQAGERGVAATFHGRLDQPRLWEFYKWADAGISAFGLHRKGLAAASSLKVREYLSAGLPVILQGTDDAFPEHFPHVLSLPSFTLDAVEAWLDTRPHVTRAGVRADARPHISLQARIKALGAFAAG